MNLVSSTAILHICTQSSKYRVHVSASIVAYNWKSTLLNAAIQILETTK